MVLFDAAVIHATWDLIPPEYKGGMGELPLIGMLLGMGLFFGLRFLLFPPTPPGGVGTGGMAGPGSALFLSALIALSINWYAKARVVCAEPLVYTPFFAAWALTSKAPTVNHRALFHS